ncbi:PIN domain-containing protein [Candidatus Poriferisocius sp.]|uniref:PIN domain-containing protein n=1 Tax=Candidatus Poriferisocius sp. TaxID=3101276 RepID=UPI003B01B054
MSSQPATYLDSSAIVKLVIDEPESAALQQFLHQQKPLVSSALARAEVSRAVLAFGPAALAAAQEVESRRVW